MAFLRDLAFCFRPRCPVCRKGRLFQKHSITVVEKCGDCGAALGAHDIGDGAAVFLIFFLGASLIPMALLLDKIAAPPLWVHALVFGFIGMGIVLLLLPAVKAYIMLLDWRHRGETKN
ncbi:MAG: DUF983 domain-containing protein [Micavibrio sp.]|nr:DUF983 domain-containing protein [Micavibrio sp.]